MENNLNHPSGIQLEKGKKYLLRESSFNDKINEVDVLDITKTCFKLEFKKPNLQNFWLNFGEVKWVLKTNFLSTYEILEELEELK